MNDALELRAELRTLRETLEGWPAATTWDQFTEAAHRVGPALHDLVQALDLWDQMHPADRAAVLRVMGVGARYSKRLVEQDSERLERHVAEILRTVDYIYQESAWAQGLIDRPGRRMEPRHAQEL